jgi:1-acyl-sn-glycerol-3-phosphate acyltransferase
VGRVHRRERLPPWYRVAVILLLPLCRLVTRRRWTGQEHVPAEGGVIVAANHISLVDPVLLCDFLLHGTGLVPRFMAKSTMFRGRGLLARVMRGAQQIPVERGGADAAAALDAAVEALERGACVVIYPEGTTTRDPDLWPMRPRTGVARLALLSGAPVLPVAQWGAADIHRRGNRRVRVVPPTRVRFHIGRPVDLSAYAGRTPDAEVLREATATVMDAITTELEHLRGERRPAQVHDPSARSARTEQNRESA